MACVSQSQSLMILVFKSRKSFKNEYYDFFFSFKSNLVVRFTSVTIWYGIDSIHDALIYI